MLKKLMKNKTWQNFRRSNTWVIFCGTKRETLVKFKSFSILVTIRQFLQQLKLGDISHHQSHSIALPFKKFCFYPKKLKNLRKVTFCIINYWIPTRIPRTPSPLANLSPYPYGYWFCYAEKNECWNSRSLWGIPNPKKGDLVTLKEDELGGIGEKEYYFYDCWLQVEFFVFKFVVRIIIDLKTWYSVHPFSCLICSFENLQKLWTFPQRCLICSFENRQNLCEFPQKRFICSSENAQELWNFLKEVVFRIRVFDVLFT